MLTHKHRCICGETVEIPCPNSVPKSRADKKYLQDKARAEAAISAIIQHVNTQDETVDFQNACYMEVERLREAIADPKRLWSIYRRADRSGQTTYSHVITA